MKLHCALCGRPVFNPAVLIGQLPVGPTCARRAGLVELARKKVGSLSIPRAKFTRLIYSRDWADEKNFDLVIDTGQVTDEAAMDQIIDAYRALMTGQPAGPRVADIQPDPVRTRKLLLHKAEIRKLDQAVMQKGLTLVPLSLYFKDGRIKLELAICKGKKLYDKRDDLAKRDAERDMERSMKERY